LNRVQDPPARGGSPRSSLVGDNRCVLVAPFDWLYGKLGARYPKLFVTLELQAGFLITIATVLLLSAYYDGSVEQFGLLVGIALALSVPAIGLGLYRILPRVAVIGDWIGGRRDDAFTEQAWRAVVGLPLALVRDEALISLVAVVAPATVAAVAIFGLSWISVLPLLGAGAVAVGYAAILHHLTLEIGLRPVLIDMNQAVKPELTREAVVLPLRWRLLAVLPMINVITGLTVAAISGADSLGVAVLAAIGVATTLSLELTLLLTRSVMQPIKDLQRATDHLRAGNLDAAVPVTTADEIGELAASFNDMVGGLRERERIRDAFGTYLDEEVAAHILSEGFSEGGEQVEVSILFCDVKDFTSFAEAAEAAEVVSCLNALFEVVVPIIAAAGGHVDKFEGDGLMAVFGAPQHFPDHADRALRAAIEIDRRVNDLGEGGPFEIGIGINTGRVVAGSVGGAGRLNFSVIGDAVNVAARVEAETRLTGEDLLLTAATRERLRDEYALRRVGERELRGLERPIELYAPAGEPAEPRRPIGAVRAVYARVRGNRAAD